MSDDRLEKLMRPYYTPMFKGDSATFLWDIIVVLFSKNKGDFVEAMLCGIPVKSIDELKANFEMIMNLSSWEAITLISIVQTVFEFLVKPELPHELVMAFLEESINQSLCEASSINRFTEALVDRLSFQVTNFGINSVQFDIAIIKKIKENVGLFGLDVGVIERIEFNLASGSNAMSYVIEHVLK